MAWQRPFGISQIFGTSYLIKRWPTDNWLSPRAVWIFLLAESFTLGFDLVPAWSRLGLAGKKQAYRFRLVCWGQLGTSWSRLSALLSLASACCYKPSKIIVVATGKGGENLHRLCYKFLKIQFHVVYGFIDRMCTSGMIDKPWPYLEIGLW